MKVRRGRTVARIELGDGEYEDEDGEEEVGKSHAPDEVEALGGNGPLVESHGDAGEEEEIHAESREIDEYMQ